MHDIERSKALRSLSTLTLFDSTPKKFLDSVDLISIHEHGAIMVTKSDDVYALGSTNNFRFGSQFQDIFLTHPRKIKALCKRGAVFARLYQNCSALITSKGDLFISGNLDCACGRILNNTPKQIQVENVKFEDVKCTSLFIIAQSRDGHLYSWGCNFYGNLGIGPTHYQRNPQRIEGALKEKRVVMVECTEYHCLGLTSDGEVYGWGNNQNSQVGHDSQKFQNVPHKVLGLDKRIVRIACIPSVSMGLDIEGYVYYWGAGVIPPKKLRSKLFSNLRDIALLSYQSSWVCVGQRAQDLVVWDIHVEGDATWFHREAYIKERDTTIDEWLLNAQKTRDCMNLIEKRFGPIAANALMCLRRKVIFDVYFCCQVC